MIQSEQESLLPVTNVPTQISVLNASKYSFKVFEIYRALLHGYLPSTAQVVSLLRSRILPLSEVNPASLSQEGNVFITQLGDFIIALAELLEKKNGEDQLQNLLYHVKRSEMEISTDQMLEQIYSTQITSDAKATYQSLTTLLSVFYSNREFQDLLEELGLLLKQIISDVAETVAEVAQNVAEETRLDEHEKNFIQDPSTSRINSKDIAHEEPSALEFLDDGPFGDVARSVEASAKEIASSAIEVSKAQVYSDRRHTILIRLRNILSSLQKNPIYIRIVNFMLILIKNYIRIYCDSVEDGLTKVEEDLRINRDLDMAIQNSIALITKFGSEEEWNSFRNTFERTVTAVKHQRNIKVYLCTLADLLGRCLKDPPFILSEEVKMEFEATGLPTDNETLANLNDLVTCGLRVMTSMGRDKETIKVLHEASQLLMNAFSSKGDSLVVKPALLDDFLDVMLPKLVRLVQNIPIPRIEFSTPDVDVLIENLVLVPGRTLNSFFPIKVSITNFNEITMENGKKSNKIAKASVKIQGLSVSAENMAFWFRKKTGLIKLETEGSLSIWMDKKGMDIEIDVEFSTGDAENIIQVKDVRVQIHRFQYKIQHAKFSRLLTLLRPFLSPLLRVTIAKFVESKLADLLHVANRESVFLRERFRAAVIANNQNYSQFISFFRAIFTTFVQTAQDEEVKINVGFMPRVFEGKYTRDSVVKSWIEDDAEMAIQGGSGENWENLVFDV